MGTIWFAYRSASRGRWDDVKDWMQAVLPAETGILGSALGFYFARERERDRD
jgi:hypothetical protein